MMKKPDHFILVDDDRTNNLICEFNIRRSSKSARIDIFTDPTEALSVIGEKYPGESPEPILLFLDLNMPAMTGWEFLETFAGLPESKRQQFCIYILSSSIETLDEELKAYPFVDGFISKPLKFECLQEILNKFEEPAYI